MPPDAVLLHAVRTAPRDRVRRALHAAMDTLAQGDDWLEMERLIREQVGLADALRILGDESGGDGAPSPQKPGRKRRG